MPITLPDNTTLPTVDEFLDSPEYAAATPEEREYAQRQYLLTVNEAASRSLPDWKPNDIQDIAARFRPGALSVAGSAVKEVARELPSEAWQGVKGVVRRGLANADQAEAQREILRRYDPADPMEPTLANFLNPKNWSLQVPQSPEQVMRNAGRDPYKELSRAQATLDENAGGAVQAGDITSERAVQAAAKAMGESVTESGLRLINPATAVEGAFDTEKLHTVLQDLQGKGLDVRNPEAARAFMTDPKNRPVIEAAIKRGNIRGSTIGVFDAIGQALGIKFVRSREVAKEAGKKVGDLSTLAGSALIEGATGGAGELSGQVASGEEINPEAAILEFAAGMPGAAAHGAGAAMLADPTPANSPAARPASSAPFQINRPGQTAGAAPTEADPAPRDVALTPAQRRMALKALGELAYISGRAQRGELEARPGQIVDRPLKPADLQNNPQMVEGIDQDKIDAATHAQNLRTLYRELEAQGYSREEIQRTMAKIVNGEDSEAAPAAPAGPPKQLPYEAPATRLERRRERRAAMQAQQAAPAPEAAPAAPPAPAPVPLSQSGQASPQGDGAGVSATPTPTQPARTTTEPAASSFQAPAQPTGPRFEASVPNRTEKISGEWSIVDADELVSSDRPNFRQELQPRNRQTVTSREKIEKMAKELNGDELTMDSAYSDTGPMIVSNDNMVLSGNGRTMAIRRAREAYPERMAEYQQKLAARADSLGIAGQMKGKRTPVLVRRLTDFGGMTPQEFVEYSNQRRVSGRNEAEQAEADAKIIANNNLFRIFAPSDAGNMLAASNRSFLHAFIGRIDDGDTLKTATGQFAAALGNRVRRAVLASIIGPDRRGVIIDAIDSADDLSIRNQLEGILVPAGRLVNLARTKPAYSIVAELGRAIEDLMSFKRQLDDKMVSSIENFVKQSDMFSTPRTPEEEILLIALANARSKKQVSDILSNYATAAEAIDATPDMFGAPNPTNRQLLELATNAPETKTTQAEPDLFPTGGGSTAGNGTDGGSPSVPRQQAPAAAPTAKQAVTPPASDSKGGQGQPVSQGPKPTQTEAEAVRPKVPDTQKKAVATLVSGKNTKLPGTTIFSYDTKDTLARIGTFTIGETTLSGPQEIAAVVRGIRSDSQEKLVLVPIENDGSIGKSGIVVLTMGTIDATSFDASLIIRAWKSTGSPRFAISHNHPGGDPSPSKADIRATELLKEALGDFDAKDAFVDHVVINGTTAWSIGQGKKINYMPSRGNRKIPVSIIGRMDGDSVDFRADRNSIVMAETSQQVAAHVSGHIKPDTKESVIVVALSARAQVIDVSSFVEYDKYDGYDSKQILERMHRLKGVNRFVVTMYSTIDGKTTGAEKLAVAGRRERLRREVSESSLGIAKKVVDVIYMDKGKTFKSTGNRTADSMEFGSDFLYEGERLLPTAKRTARRRGNAGLTLNPAALFSGRQPAAPKVPLTGAYAALNNPAALGPGKFIRAWRSVKDTLDARGMGIDNAFIRPISSVLKDISPVLSRGLRGMWLRYLRTSLRDVRKVKPLVQALGKLQKDSPIEFAAMKQALLNSDTVMADKIATAYGFLPQLNASRQVLTQLEADAKAAGIEFNSVTDYWPRMVPDYEKFREFLTGTPHFSLIEKAISSRNRELGRAMSATEEAAFTANLLRGYNDDALALTTNSTKERLIKQLTPEMLGFYEDPGASLVAHISHIRKTIESRKYFGLDRDSQGQTLLTPDDIIAEQIRDLVKRKEMDSKDELVVKAVLTAFFNNAGPGKLARVYRNVEYIDTMGTFISAMASLEDIAIAIKEAGLVNTAVGLGKASAEAGKRAVALARTGKRDTRQNVPGFIAMEDIGLSDIAEEMIMESGIANSRGLVRATSKLVSMVFDGTGMKVLDALGKETLLNAKFRQLQQQAKAGRFGEANNRLLDHAFNAQDRAAAINDLKAGRLSELTREVLFHAVSDVQPISPVEVPLKYLEMRNGKLFYMLKTFALRRLDYLRNEITDTKIPFRHRLKNAALLVALIMAAGMTKDEAVDWLLNRETELPDRVLDNLFKLVGINKFFVYEARKDGPMMAIVKLALPPVGLIDAAVRDAGRVISGKDDKLELPGRIPFVGKFYYWWFGRGAERQEEKAEERSYKPEVNWLGTPVDPSGFDKAVDAVASLAGKDRDDYAPDGVGKPSPRMQVDGVERKMTGAEYQAYLDLSGRYTRDLIAARGLGYGAMTDAHTEAIAEARVQAKQELFPQFYGGSGSSGGSSSSRTSRRRTSRRTSRRRTSSTESLDPIEFRFRRA